jgi:hypothetical protein
VLKGEFPNNIEFRWPMAYNQDLVLAAYLLQTDYDDKVDATRAQLTHDHPYADEDHSHAGYASAVHTHPETPHTHLEYAPVVHTHEATPHSHNYAPTIHNHDSAYSATGHTHSGFVSDTDPRLSDARTPTTHTHNYADPSHTHPVATHSHVDADIPATIARDAEVAAAYSPINHTHAGSGPVVKRKTADQANNSNVTLQDVADLTFPVVANTSYALEFFVYFVAAATTTGPVFALNGPLLPAGVNYGAFVPTAATTVFNAGATTYDSALVASASPSTTVPHLATVTALVRNGVNAGNVALRFRSEVNASAVTIKAGSWARCTQI